jgi:ATP-dependent DNA ligase
MIKKSLPKLFSRTNTGAVQEWTVEIEGNKFRVIHGQTDGKKTEGDWTVCTGKNIGKANETDPELQALTEAQARWKKQTETGYTEDVKKIDSCLTYIEPMLANKLKTQIKKIVWKLGVWVQNKYNGVRCVATFERGRVVLKSRKGKEWFSVPHINKDLEAFFAKYPDAVLDGELYNYDLRRKLNELIHIVRKSPKHITQEDLDHSEEMVLFYIYDGYGFIDALGIDAEYELRKEWIDKNLPKYSKYYRHVLTEKAYSMEEVDKIYFRYLADEQEGAIIRIPKTSYENKRSNSLLKYKPEDDSEGIITALHEGTTDWAGTAKTATIDWNGIIVDATFKGSKELGVERLKHPELWIGKKVTFLFNGLTGKGEGKPQYARIDPLNCFKAEDGDNEDED